MLFRSGNLYIADSGNSRIRKVSNGVITTMAGDGTFGFSGDSGPATGAELYGALGVGVDSTGNVYIADSYNHRVRVVLAPYSPSINAGGIVNAASYLAGTPLVPGSIATAYGNFLLSAPSSAPGTPLPTNLSGLSMQFGSGVLAPLFYADLGQVNFQVPWELGGQTQASLSATVNGQAGASQTVSLAAFAPGIFAVSAQGTGQGAILDNATYRVVDASNPATAGSTLVQIYCTGLGAVNNPPATGAAAPNSPYSVTSTTPTVTIGGAPATVLFSGLAPGFVGGYQVNALVPAGASRGTAVPVVLSIGGAQSNTVTMAVR